MIFSENRFTLFRIMPWALPSALGAQFDLRLAGTPGSDAALNEAQNVGRTGVEFQP